MGPRRTTFEKPSPLPAMIAVPQSGPITSRSSEAARCFSLTSSSSEYVGAKAEDVQPEL